MLKNGEAPIFVLITVNKSNQTRETLMDVIDDRYNQVSTIVLSQIPVSVWYDIKGEETIAVAILDRIVNSSHLIDLKGESLRKRI